MKILIVTNLYPTLKKPQWGTFVYEQVNLMRKKYKGELQIAVHLVDGSETKINYLKSLFILPFIVKKEKYDLVHVHYGLTLLSVLLVRVPIVVTWHGSDALSSPSKYVAQLLKYKASAHIVVSANIKEKLRDGKIIPCGINVKKFQFSKDRFNNAETKINRTKKLKILFPSNPGVKIKNYNLFSQVCEKMKDKGYKIQEVYLKGIDREKVPSVFWGSDIMLLTSFSEGSPTVIKEAIAAKLPFVSVDVGDVNEWCKQISFGKVVKNSDPDAIVEKIQKLLGKIKNRNKLDNSKVIPNMDNAFLADQIKAVYEAVLDRQKI